MDFNDIKDPALKEVVSSWEIYMNSSGEKRVIWVPEDEFINIMLPVNEGQLKLLVEYLEQNRE